MTFELLIAALLAAAPARTRALALDVDGADPSRAPAATAPARQDASTPAAEGGWEMLDGVEMVVDEDIVTLRQLRREVELLRRRGQVTKTDDMRAIVADVKTLSIRRRLSVQAGERMGVDRAIIERQVRLRLEREAERMQGVVGLSEYLHSRDIDAQRHRREIEEEAYQHIWTDYVTGEGPAPQASRVSVDRYVRPGQLLFEWRHLVAQPQGLPAIGGRPQSVVLQFLIVDPHTSGVEPDRARRLAIQLRERILDGEDMAELNRQYGAAKNSFQPPPMDEARLKQVEPALGAFVEHAREGDLSEVMAYASSKGPAWRIVRLVSREAPVVPALESIDVQTKLVDLYTNDLTEYRLSSGFDDLFRAAYVWPPELKGGAARAR